MATQRYVEELERNIELMRRLRFQSEAVPRYDCLSDAVVWSDEVPEEIPFADVGFLRHVLHFRIVRLKSPAVAMDDIWERLRQLCPGWPGFREERCNCDATLKLYDDLRPRAYPRILL